MVLKEEDLNIEVEWVEGRGSLHVSLTDEQAALAIREQAGPKCCEHLERCEGHSVVD